MTAAAAAQHAQHCKQQAIRVKCDSYSSRVGSAVRWVTQKEPIRTRIRRAQATAL
jgi:hypothetical protein